MLIGSTKSEIIFKHSFSQCNGSLHTNQISIFYSCTIRTRVRTALFKSGQEVTLGETPIYCGVSPIALSAVLELKTARPEARAPDTSRLSSPESFSDRR